MGSKLLKSNTAFDYSDENRENTVNALFAEAKIARGDRETLWQMLDAAYFRFRNRNAIDIHIDAESDTIEQAKQKEVGLTDEYIQIESQINPDHPEPMFKGRDNKQDSSKAKQREYIVKYVLYANDIKSKNTSLERSVKKYGDGFYKVYYDANKLYADNERGDICIEPLNVDDIFPDPTASNLDDCEYIDYVYYIHRQKAKRLWGKLFKKAKIDINELITETPSITQPLVSDSVAAISHEVQIVEHWYKDDEGDIALSMLINGKEFNHISKYWQETGEQNKLYPFIHFFTIKDERNFWNISELEVILPLCDIQNRMLNAGLKNMEMMSNDVWLRQYRDDAEIETNEITAEEGSVINYPVGVEAPRRAGGLNSMDKFLESIERIEYKIQRTTRNYDSNLGAETKRVTTASGVAQLRADAAEQSNKKDFDKLQAWKRLFILIDWTALEFYKEERLIYIGVPKRVGKKIDVSGRQEPMLENLDTAKGDIFFTFKSSDIRQTLNPRQVTNEQGELVDENDGYYYPTIDCEVSPTNSAQTNAIIDTLMQLASIKLTVDNYKFVIKAVSLLDIPDKDEIIDEIEGIFEPEAIPELSDEMNTLISYLPLETQAMIRKQPHLLMTALQGVPMAESGREERASNVMQPQTPQAPEPRFI